MTTTGLPSLALGNLMEICFVTSDIYKTIDGLSTMGIGPFQIYKFDSETTYDTTYKGQAANFTLTVAFAQHNDLTIEIMQPDSGPSLMEDYLQENGGKEGIQHIAFDMGGEKVPMKERIRIMKERGVNIGMSGVWKGAKGKCEFTFFDTKAVTGTVFETIEFSNDWVEPDGQWYPRKPEEK